ncbi:hypothetical protein HPB50_022760 [Hyalomma asiaticum]|uniref:Uncharacterized protein n=1 Tax=Hyalomma asiaticum TaxID=266040 RepID=A0ACB7RVE1_HYAAI|nr:hypothetical protein HPB50_022760 [Hyalomma asiaticum]
MRCMDANESQDVHDHVEDPEPNNVGHWKVVGQVPLGWRHCGLRLRAHIEGQAAADIVACFARHVYCPILLAERKFPTEQEPTLANGKWSAKLTCVGAPLVYNFALESVAKIFGGHVEAGLLKELKVYSRPQQAVDLRGKAMPGAAAMLLVMSGVGSLMDRQSTSHASSTILKGG